MGGIRRVLVIGAGGHARVCIEALCDDEDNEMIGAVSSDGSGLSALGVPMLGRDADLAALVRQLEVSHAFVAIGDNRDRSAMSEALVAVGVPELTAHSRYARPSHSARFGPGCALLPGATVNACTVLGRSVIVNTNASIDHDCAIGDHVHVAPGVAIAGWVTIGARVLVGIGASVIPGVSIGDDATVGAGAVVIHDVARGVTVVGVPAATLQRRSR